MGACMPSSINSLMLRLLFLFMSFQPSIPGIGCRCTGEQLGTVDTSHIVQGS
ncbi:hypothetical protein M758_10G008400 [Ceratodon purpureus]|nr:hypothetical protein M758_10G008400 [Ceratodon purpureus]